MTDVLRGSSWHSSNWSWFENR